MFDFEFTEPFDGPLVHPLDQWPVFNSVTVSFFSTDRFFTPSSEAKQDALPFIVAPAGIPVPPSRASLHNADQNHISRPQDPISAATVQDGNRHVTRIIAQGWSHLSETERQGWHDKDAAEWRQHTEPYSGYRFGPTRLGNRHVKLSVRKDVLENMKC